jgi:branched-chain amino acid transport system substrate-binding protein
MRRKTRSIVLAGILGFVANLAVAEDLVIGQVAPLSGVLADTGKEMVLGGKIYFDHINAHGGILGRKIVHIVKDDGYKTDETVKLTKELIEQQRPVALFGYAGTGNIGELLKQQVLANANIALVAPYTGGEPLREPFNRNIFHIRAGYSDETAAMVEQLVGSGMTRVAVFYQDDPFGKAGLNGVEAALKRHELQVVARGAYEKNTDSVDHAVEIIGKANPQAVIMIAVNKPSAAFIKRFRAGGGSALLFNISVVNAKELTRLVGSETVRGTGISQVMPYPFQAVLPVVKEYQELMKRYAPNAEISYTSLEEFIGAKVLVEGLRRSGPNPTRESVMKALESLRSYDVGGFTVSFAPNNRIGSRFVEITVISKDGKPVH